MDAKIGLPILYKERGRAAGSDAQQFEGTFERILRGKRRRGEEGRRRSFALRVMRKARILEGHHLQIPGRLFPS